MWVPLPRRNRDAVLNLWTSWPGRPSPDARSDASGRSIPFVGPAIAVLCPDCDAALLRDSRAGQASSPSNGRPRAIAHLAEFTSTRSPVGIGPLLNSAANPEIVPVRADEFFLQCLRQRQPDKRTAFVGKSQIRRTTDLRLEGVPR